MAKKVSKNVPIAKRIVEFKREDFKDNNLFFEFIDGIITEEMLEEELTESVLVVVDGRDILQYVNEYPIVVYECDENILDENMIPMHRLNCFVRRVVVSTGVNGRRISVGLKKINEEILDFNTIVYYEDNVGYNHAIIQNDICCFLLKKPKLVVSEEGILIFYTEDEILVTADCNQYAWVHCDEITENCNTIESIKVYHDYCEVNLIDVVDGLGKVVKKAPRNVLKLYFNLKLAHKHMINPIITRKS